MKREKSKKKWFENDDRPISVDIVCFVYNHSDYLKQAFDGMLSQKTDFPFRIIVHDDASTDSSAAIIHEYQDLYPDRIVPIYEKENLFQNGKSIHRKLYPYLNSKYLAYCEGDDFWTDDHKLQKQIEYLEQNTDCVAVYHNILPVNKYGEYDESLRHIYSLLDEGDYTDDEIMNFKLRSQTASLVCRNFNMWITDEQLEFYRKAKLNGDIKDFLLYGLKGRIHYLPDVMAAHRRVLDEGDSWTAMQQKKSPMERFVDKQNIYIEECRFYSYFSKKHIYPYNIVIERCIVFAKKRAIQLGTLMNSIGIPMYAYLAVIPHLMHLGLRRIFMGK